MNYQCESCSAAQFRAFLGPASAPPDLINVGDATSCAVCSQHSFDSFPNTFGLPYDAGSSVTLSPTVLSLQPSSIDSMLHNGLGSVPTSMSLQDWENPFYGAWGDAAETPKLVQRQMKRRIQNRASQRAFRERKEKHAKSLQDKIDQLESMLGDMRNANEDLKRQLEELLAKRDADENDESKSVSSASDFARTPTTRDTSPTNQVLKSWPDTGAEREKERCRGCRRLFDDVDFECEHFGRKHDHGIQMDGIVA